MTNFLASAVALLTVLTALNLVLNAAAIRHLRKLDKQVREGGHGGRALPEIGSTVPDFVIATTRQEQITQNDEGLFLVLTPNCAPCKELAGRIVADAVLRAEEPFVLISDRGDDQEAAAQLAATLPTVRRLAFDRHGLAGTLGVEAFPAALRLVAGKVVAASHSVDDLLPANQSDYAASGGSR